MNIEINFFSWVKSTSLRMKWKKESFNISAYQSELGVLRYESEIRPELLNFFSWAGPQKEKEKNEEEFKRVEIVFYNRRRFPVQKLFYSLSFSILYTLCSVLCIYTHRENAYKKCFITSKHVSRRWMSFKL